MEVKTDQEIVNKGFTSGKEYVAVDDMNNFSNECLEKLDREDLPYSKEYKRGMQDMLLVIKQELKR